jgi:hypothetical protein
MLLSRGIQLVYTEDVADLDPAILKRYDGLLIYANIDRITQSQENALLDYVERRRWIVRAALRLLLLPEFGSLRGSGWRPVQHSQDG